MLDSGVHLLESRDARESMGRYVEGWEKFYLPKRISSKDEFFDAVRSVLPLDPPLQSNRSWDALEDSVWSGLYDLNAEKIVIVWPDFSVMADNDPEEAKAARGVFESISKTISDNTVTVGNPKTLLVILIK